MKKLFLLILTAIMCPIAAAAQTPRPATMSTPPSDDDVVRISTDLIQIDVTATDNKGRPVTDLKPEDFEIYENGERQTITNLSFVSAVRPTKGPTPAAARDAVPVPQRAIRPDQIRRTIALVVDDLSLSFESAYRTRQALRKFVDEQMQDGDLVAIIRTGAGVGALQQFTSDKRLLYAAIEKVKWNPNGNGGITAFAPIEQADPNDSTVDDTGTQAQTPEPEGSGQTLDSFRSTIFSTGTLGALRYIVTGMSRLPGRKTVILFSDGFQLFEKDENGNEIGSLVLDFLQQLVDLANRSSVVFYTVDVRGLANTGFTAADRISDTNPAAMESARSSRTDLLHDTQEGLSYLAEETGGFALLNNNDISGEVRRVLEDQSYYLIAYEPSGDTFDPAKRKFNSLTVKVKRPGVNVRYRSGFFNVAERAEGGEAANGSSAANIEAALLSPFAVNGIDLRLNALFRNDAKDGSFVRSLLHINAGDLKFTDEKDGTKKASFEVIAASFGDNGQIVDRLARAYTLSLKPDAFKKLAAEGFVYNFAFPVKKAGAYQYRVAIRDPATGRVGSASQFIEVPDISKRRLATSSIVLGNITAADWIKNHGTDMPADPMSDNALRRVRIGSVLRYGLEIYNAKLDQAKQPHVRTKVRVYRDGKLILDGKDSPVDLHGQNDLQRLRVGGALAIGEKLLPGEYILQILVTDELAKNKQQLTAQLVQFEVVGQ